MRNKIYSAVDTRLMAVFGFLLSSGCDGRKQFLHALNWFLKIGFRANKNTVFHVVLCGPSFHARDIGKRIHVYVLIIAFPSFLMSHVHPVTGRLHHQTNPPYQPHDTLLNGHRIAIASPLPTVVISSSPFASSVRAVLRGPLANAAPSILVPLSMVSTNERTAGNTCII
jgi:hypothetical protein